MGSQEFLNICKAKVADYYNEHCEKTDVANITVNDVYTVWYCKTLQNHKALLSTTAPDGMDYINLYKGYTSGIPSSMADMEIITIGAAKKGIVDIQVAKPKLDVDGIRAKMNKKNFMETCF